MKRKSTALVVFSLVLTFSATRAQLLVVEERTVKNEESIDLNSWTARLDQDVDFCEETYSDFIKEIFKIKVDKRGKTMLVAEKALIPELSNLRLDQRAIFAPESGGTAVSFTFSPGYDIHFGHELYKDEFKKAEAFVKNYVRYHYKAFYNAQVKSLQDKIKNKQSDIDSNGKKTDKNNKAIADNKTEGETEKTKAKNEKMARENDAYASDTASKRREISDLTEELSKVNESLRKVEAFN